MDTPVGDLLLDGLWLMGIGLGVVFSFLLILVAILVLMSRAVARWGPAEPLAQSLTATAPVPGADPVPGAGHARVIAAITAAIHAYRRRHAA
ncbi:OadG family transporter subunit [Thiocapsa imhoffii]